MLRVNSLSAITGFARSFGILLTTCLLTMAVLGYLSALALGPGLERFLLGRPSVWHNHLEYFCGSFRSTSAVLHEHLQEVLADLIADEVRKDLQGRRKKGAQIPPDLLVQHLGLDIYWDATPNPDFGAPGAIAPKFGSRSFQFSTRFSV